MEQGSIKVFGKDPGDPSQHSMYQVPGPAVGYMPQEHAIYEDLTIAETFLFHAGLHGMTRDQLAQRQKWLMGFLDLPATDRIVGSLSGGQQRRVSLAIALLHHPKILILDEPTVGVDPLLRDRIWTHLREIAAEGTTIIITTHYIEEASAADTVGLLRAGRLLAEGPPKALMSKYNHKTLEDVFLYLCRVDEKDHPETVKAGDAEGGRGSDAAKDDGKKPSTPRKPSRPKLKGRHSNPDGTPESPRPPKQGSSGRKGQDGSAGSKFIRPGVVWSLTRRKTTHLLKSKFTLFLAFLTPCFQILMLSLVIGEDPQALNLAIVNEDLGWAGLNFGDQVVDKIETEHARSFIVDKYDSFDEGLDAVVKGHAWGMVNMRSRFTTAIWLRSFECDFNATEGTDTSTVHVYLDKSDQQVALLMQKDITAAITEAAEDFLGHSISLPVNLVDPPVYGTVSPKFVSFLAPGMIVYVVFTFHLSLSAVVFVGERLSATLERVYVTGASPLEIMLGHVFAYTIMLLGQVVFLLGITVFMFNIPIRIELAIVIVLAMLIGWASMAGGILIASRSSSEFEAMQAAVTGLFLVMTLAGVIWPLESAPAAIQTFAHTLHVYWAVEAYRAIMLRGWNLSNQVVINALLMCILWFVVIILMAMQTLLVQKSSSKPSLLSRIGSCICFWRRK